MDRGAGRILTTHMGSLPRAEALADLLIRQDNEEAIDETALSAEIDAAVGRVVERQLASGVDIGNDGEQPRVGFQTYVGSRMSGFGGEGRRPEPPDMVLVTGAVDSTSNYVEHAEVVAERIVRAVQALGDRERVIAGVDCGFGTFAGYSLVADDVVWAKLEALSAGARLASERLWS